MHCLNLARLVQICHGPKFSHPTIQFGHSRKCCTHPHSALSQSSPTGRPSPNSVSQLMRLRVDPVEFEAIVQPSNEATPEPLLSQITNTTNNKNSPLITYHHIQRIITIKHFISRHFQACNIVPHLEDVRCCLRSQKEELLLAGCCS